MYLEHTASVMHQHRARDIARNAEMRRLQNEREAAPAPRPVVEPHNAHSRIEGFLTRVAEFFTPNPPVTPTRI